MQQFIISKNDKNQRLDKFLLRQMPNAGLSFICKMLRKKNITVNDKKAEGKYMLKETDIVKIFFSDDTYHKMAGSNSIQNVLTNKANEYRKAYDTFKGIHVLYEDDDVIFLNKPANLLSQKAKEEDLSINEWLIGYLLHNKEITDEQLKTFKPSIANRLDRNTSGLIMCGKTLPGLQLLASLLKDRKVHKYYRAVVCGCLNQSMDLSGYLLKDTKTNRVTISNNPKEGYDKIETRYQPIKTSVDYTELEVLLVTGKTHQIRAHLSHIGHPILGDPKYGLPSKNKLTNIMHQQLHAYRIVFPALQDFPNLSEKEFICPLPDNWYNIN